MKEKGIEEIFAVMKRLHENGHACVLHLIRLNEEDYQEKIRLGCQQDGRIGLLCESRNADSLCLAMMRMMELPREERISMGRAGRRYMENTSTRKWWSDRQ